MSSIKFLALKWGNCDFIATFSNILCDWDRFAYSKYWGTHVVKAMHFRQLFWDVIDILNGVSHNIDTLFTKAEILDKISISLQYD